MASPDCHLSLLPSLVGAFRHICHVASVLSRLVQTGAKSRALSGYPQWRR